MRVLPRWLLVTLVVAGCGARQRPHATGDVYLAKLRVEGNTSIPSKDLIGSLALDDVRQAGHELDYYKLELDTRRVRGAYLRLGFFDVKVTSHVENPRGAQVAVFVVAEGPRSKTSLDRNSFPGLPPEVPVEKALAAVELVDGDPFDYEKYDDAKQVLLQLVQDAGYPYVALDANVVADRQRRVANVRYAFEPGPRAQFGNITITGVDGFPDLREAIIHRITWKPGGLYSQTAITKTQQSLYDLGRFATVNVDPDRTDKTKQVVDVAISVTLTTRHELKVGGGAGLEPLTYELRARGGYLYIPEDHPLWTLSGDLRLALTKARDLKFLSTDGFEPKSRVLLSATRIDLLMPQLRFDVAGGLEYNTVEAYTASGPLARLGFTYPLRRWLQLRAGWAFEYLSFSGVSGALDATAQDQLRITTNGGHERLASFQQAIVADLRDDRIEPHRGWYLDLRVNEGTKYAGSALRFLQVNPDVRVYAPLGKRIVLAARARGGTIFGQVPVTERYFSGGAQSQRGFSERQLAPSRVHVDEMGVESSVLVGGGALLETGAELRVPIGTLAGIEFGLTLFADGGDVTETLAELDPLNLHWAAGMGLSLKVAGIKIRFDVAQRLNRYGFGEPEFTTGTLAHTLFHVGIGETY